MTTRATRTKSTAHPGSGARPGATTRTDARAAAPRRRGRYGAPAVLLAPFLVLFTACTLVPIGYAVKLSLFTEH
ncbi:hypothetical protein ACFC6U_40695, partial [Kitasatospora purpeofusca]